MRSLTALAVFGWVAIHVPSAHAVPVAPGETHAVPEDKTRDGAAVVDGPYPFAIQGPGGNVFLTGLIQGRVVKLNEGGWLSMNLRVRDLEALAGTPSVVRVDYSGFAGIATDVVHGGDYIAPKSVTRSGGAGDVLGFAFEPGLMAPPRWSAFLLATTDAKGIDLGGTCTIHAIGPDGLVYQTTITGLPRAVKVPPHGGTPRIERLSTYEFQVIFPVELAVTYRLEWSNNLVTWTEFDSLWGYETPASRAFYPGALTGPHPLPPKFFIRVASDP